MVNSNDGIVLVLSAPSGTGKTTLANLMVHNHPDAVRSVISHTTRPPRAGERDGEDYHFVNGDQFEDLIGEDAFVEWAEVHGYRYGTAWKSLQAVLESGLDAVLDIDVQGGLNIRKAFGFKSILVFLLPPTLEVMLHRLQKRGGEPGFSLSRRLETAQGELEKASSYDYHVTNDRLEEAVRMVEATWRTARVRNGCADAHLEALRRAICQRLKETDHDF